MCKAFISADASRHHLHEQKLNCLAPLEGWHITTIQNSIGAPLSLAIFNSKFHICNIKMNDIIDAILSGKKDSFKEQCSEELSIQRDLNGWALIHWIAYCDEKEMLLELLCRYPKTILEKTYRLQTVLHIAAQQSSSRCLNTLLLLPSEDACFSNLAMDSLINLGNEWDETCLHIAAANCNADIIKLLLAGGASPLALDLWKRTPYIVALEVGRLEDVLVLLRNEISASLLNVQDKSISIAIDSKKAVKDQIAKDFLAAVEKRKERVFSSLRSSPSDIISVKKPSEVPRSSAPGHQTKMISLSQRVEYPGDIDAVKIMVAQRDHYELNGRDMFGLTALHKFSSWNKVDLIDLLLPLLTVDEVNAVSPDGYSSLHHAVESRASESIARLLQDDRVDATLINKGGKTAAAMAQETGFNTIIQLFNLS